MYSCHSYYSFRYGTLSPVQLAEEAKKHGVSSLLLTDINNTSAYFDFYRGCINQGIKPLIGIEFRDENFVHLFTGVARNKEGLYELNRFYTEHSLESKPFPKQAPIFKNVFVIYRLSSEIPEELNENEFIGIAPFEIPRLYSSPWKKQLTKLVAFSPVTFADENGFKIHQLLRAIDQNTLLTKLDPTNIAHSSEHFHNREQLIYAYAAYPELLANSKLIVKQSSIEFDLKTVKNKKHFNSSKEEDLEQLTELAMKGFTERYKPDNPDHQKALARVKKELKIIYDNNFLCYFLITWDILKFAGGQGYHHVGRGSGANSIISYCLKITDVDPMTLDLYFERFINPGRSSPPDFDIDFCWNERDDIYKYILETYNNRETSENHVGLLATYSTFQYNSLVREIGKAYGLPKTDIDTILDEPRATHKHHALGEEIRFLSGKMADFPNHLSIHAGGVIITEEPINNFTALQMMPKGFPIVQFDMHVAEENAFHKYDILSQRGLGHIKDTVKLVKQNHGHDIDIHRVNDFYEDENIKKELSEARTIGCFYIESPAMRGLITKLSCSTYKTLVAASSIIRPGVAHSGMMRQYIQRFQNQDSFEYLHPIFKELLGETFGIMVYQEDVIKIAHHFGGLDLNEADILRRTMSGKNRNKKMLEEARQKFFTNCRAKDCTDELITEVWRQIDSFSGYSFCKAHSASYAVESYQSLFLKTYYPLEFMVGVINNFGGFYRTEVYVHEARMCGAKIEAPCVNNSDHLTTIKGKTIYLGFIHLKSLEENLVRKIVQERNSYGQYTSLEDFVVRTGVRKEQLCILIRIGALRFTGRSKHELLWSKSQYLQRPKPERSARMLFRDTEDNYSMPELETDELEEAYEQLELLGFPLSSPFDLLQTKFRGDIPAKKLADFIGKEVKMVGYFVNRKDVRTVNGKIMNFGTWVDVEGKFFDTTHFPFSLETNPFQGDGCYLIKGKVTEDFKFPSIEVERMARLPWRQVKEV